MGTLTRLRGLWLHEEAGVTATEYAVMLALIVIATMLTLNAIGIGITGAITKIAAAVKHMSN